MTRIFLLLLGLSVFSFNAAAIDTGGNASSIFNFQQKLAAKGDVQAQYQSGFMYETGEGIEQDIDLARMWYQKAADQGHEAASYRLSWLEIKQKGFDKTQHAQWLADIKSKASISNQEIYFLLGQMYREGIGVNKDLSKALDIMYQLGLEGMTAADNEIDLLQTEISKQERQRQRAKAAKAKKQAARTAAPAQKPASPVEPAAARKAATTTGADKGLSAAEKAARDKAERRKRYEAIMKKLAEEQAEIDRLQGEVEGKDSADADDEI